MPSLSALHIGDCVPVGGRISGDWGFVGQEDLKEAICRHGLVLEEVLIVYGSRTRVGK